MLSRMPLQTRASFEWIEHFQTSLNQRRVDWSKQPRLHRIQHRRLIRSIQAWQLGETSDGRHLLCAAKGYATRVGDNDYLTAIQLFIREEQKHGEHLGKYLDRIGASRLRFDLGDWLFRRVRYFNSSIEAWTISVIVVESFAQLYYSALARAAHCPHLTDICIDILKDEVHHIRFQLERLQMLWVGRPWGLCLLSLHSYRFLFYGVTIAIWIAHGHVFRRSGQGFISYCRKAMHKFSRIERALLNVNDLGRTQKVSHARKKYPVGKAIKEDARRSLAQ